MHYKFTLGGNVDVLFDNLLNIFFSVIQESYAFVIFLRKYQKSTNIIKRYPGLTNETYPVNRHKHIKE